MSLDVFSAWAELLRYPGEGRSENTDAWIETVTAAAPESGEHLVSLREFARLNTESNLEELFVRTFENNSERALELGWHLHGENYARGAFMARMRGILRELEIKETVELPDHLSHLLLVLAKGEEELCAALARGVVLPALLKVQGGFSDENNPYFGVIVGLNKYISSRYGLATEKGAQMESTR